VALNTLMNVLGTLIALYLPFFEAGANPKGRRRAAAPLPPRFKY